MAAKAAGLHGVIVGGESYGQGSSREHAALCPMHLGVRAVLVKTIERMHKANLINFGIVPLVFADPKYYDRLSVDDEVGIDGLAEAISRGDPTVLMKVSGQEAGITCRVDLTPRQRRLLLAGGLLNATKAG
jgi:aconitate hydratase